MNVVSRGVRNAFRNTTRMISVVAILGLSIGLTLIMYIARQAVISKISTVESSIGNTVLIEPAGYNASSQVNNVLMMNQLGKVKVLPHVSKLTESLTAQLSTVGSGSQSSGTPNGSDTTNLSSPTMFTSTSQHSRSSAQAAPTTNLPVPIIGTTDPSDPSGSDTLTLSSGKLIDGSKDVDEAMVSTDMASKNNLHVGSTFTAYNTTFTVAGIFNSASMGVANNIIVSLPTEQRLSDQSGSITGAVAIIDSLANLNSTTTAVKNVLGSSADITSSVEAANQAVAPLDSVKSISLYSLVGAAATSCIIILLTMIMIVRERRREIGILKAIGGSNLRIMLQFVSEALTFTMFGSIIGLFFGFVGSDKVISALISSNNGGGDGGPLNILTASLNPQNITNVHSQVGWAIILYGLAAAVTIALIGSALASLFISNVRPAEVLRSE